MKTTLLSRHEAFLKQKINHNNNAIAAFAVLCISMLKRCLVFVKLNNMRRTVSVILSSSCRCEHRCCQAAGRWNKMRRRMWRLAYLILRCHKVTFLLNCYFMLNSWPTPPWPRSAEGIQGWRKSLFHIRFFFFFFSCVHPQRRSERVKANCRSLIVLLEATSADNTRSLF